MIDADKIVAEGERIMVLLDIPFNKLKTKYLMGGKWPGNHPHTCNHGVGFRKHHRTPGWRKHGRGPANTSH